MCYLFCIFRKTISAISRGSAMVDIIAELTLKGFEVWIFEPMLIDKAVVPGVVL